MTSILLIFLGIVSWFLLIPHLSTTVKHISLGIAIVLAIIILYSLLRTLILKQRNALTLSGNEKKRTEVSFVVDTFQELVGKLKEKERELEQLRAKAEDRAVRMETYNENILQSVPSGVVSIDNTLKIKSINQSAEKTLSIKAEDVIDRDCSEVFDEPLLGIIRDNKSLFRGEYPYVTGDKRHVWLGVTTSQLRNAAHETIGMILVFSDLTDVKALQAQVELKKRLTQLGEMSAGIAHELRNPMSVIAGYAKLLSKKVEEPHKTTVNAILTEIEGMDNIISEFLSFAKPTDLHKVPVHLRKMIEETASVAMSGQENMTVSIQGEDPESIMADEIMLRQAFTNLFVNAVESMPGGGTVHVDFRSENGRAIICIRDSGHGIPEDMKQKIFLPFYTSKEKGIGLGLAIVQKVIVSHGGSIDIESSEGEGTIFRIIMPLETG